MNNHTLYDNQIIENKMTDLIETKLDTQGLMEIDDSLKEAAGLTKIINRYTYEGEVECLEPGEANSVTGEVTYESEEYTVERYQQTFTYNDVDLMRDPYMLDVALKGASELMVNELNSEFFRELSHIHTLYLAEDVSYASIVDALAAIDREVEDGLILIMNADGRAAIRKDPDFIAAQQGQIVYSGQFGTLCGIPVIFSKKVPTGLIYLTEKGAVRYFVKKDATVEQAHDVETKDNTVVYERHGVIALVDDTSSLRIAVAAPELTCSVSDGTTYALVTIDSTDGVYYKINRGETSYIGEDLTAWQALPEDKKILVSYSLIRNLVIAKADENGRCEKCKYFKIR